MKVFGIGLQKTGTTTLGYCLMKLGFRHRSYDRKSIWFLRNNEEDRLKAVIDKYDSFEDEPWAHSYKIADKHFPDAKFILTIRKSEEKWFNSLANHCDRIPYNEHRPYFFGSMYPRKHKEQIISVYTKHNKEVQEYFASRPGKLLILNWEEGHGWKELCDFLGMTIPSNDLPKMNFAPIKEFSELNALAVIKYMPIYYLKIIYFEHIRHYLVKLGLRKDVSRLID